ncbi:hypothetical protein HOF40_01005 [Candidatus Parcubacteria bacterium]|jgi:hypothetical protein|nr:hypothetical protein [Candidatus Parcubacteria bacterium]MBT3948649.1 hypothetical protein [Candidatus Parcubacteria bacterium]
MNRKEPLSDGQKQQFSEALEREFRKVLMQEGKVQDVSKAEEVLNRMLDVLKIEGLNIQDFETRMAQELERLFYVDSEAIFGEGAQRAIGIFQRFFRNEGRDILFPPEGDVRDDSSELPSNVEVGPWGRK